MRRLHNLLWFWLPPIGYMMAIFFVSALPSPSLGIDTPDYVLHALEYFLLALLLIRLLLSRHGFETGFPAWQRACLTGVLIAILYSLSDEIHQYFIPGRHCSLQDVLADTVGAMLAYSIALLDYLLLTRCQPWMNFLKRYPSLSSLSYVNSHLQQIKR